MWRKVELNCRNFECPNNKDGNCSQEKVSLTPAADGIASHLICNESIVEDEPNPEKGGAKH